VHGRVELQAEVKSQEKNGTGIGVQGYIKY